MWSLKLFFQLFKDHSAWKKITIWISKNDFDDVGYPDGPLELAIDLKFRTEELNLIWIYLLSTPSRLGRMARVGWRPSELGLGSAELIRR